MRQSEIYLPWNFRMPDYVTVRFRDGTHSITSFAYVDEDGIFSPTIRKAEEAITDKIKRIADEKNISKFKDPGKK